MPKKESGPEEEEQGFKLSRLKKPTYAVGMFLSAVGILIALVLAFVINDALDKMQTSINTNIDGISALLDDTGQTVSSLDSEIGSMNATFADINSSVTSLSEGMNGTGLTMQQFGAAISQITIIPGMSQYGTQLTSSGNQIIQGAGELQQAGSLAGNWDNLAGLKTSVDSINADIANERASLADAQQSISDVIGLIKLANILVFVMFVVMFFVLMLNSAAGIL
jgi:uncharacterized protein YukE